MSFTEYVAILTDFKSSVVSVNNNNYADICRAQDLLIAELTQQGAVIKGWKLVDDDGSFIISPIFDFQIFANHGEVVSEVPQECQQQ